MKTLRTIFAVGCLSLFAQFSFGQITGTLHDFSAEPWNGTGEICVVCHTPHSADLGVPDAPLWNHELTVTVFTLYNLSPTFDGVGTIVQPDGSSKLCLSCHDGTVGLNSFGFYPGPYPVGTTWLVPGDPGFLDVTLLDDHPISFDYTDALSVTDGELYPPTTTLSGLGGFITGDMLFADKLQCASCHDVHGTAFASFLRKDNAGSALCLTCHIK